MKIRVSGAEVAVGAFVLLGVLGFLVLYVASGGYEGMGRKWVTTNECLLGIARTYESEDRDAATRYCGLALEAARARGFETVRPRIEQELQRLGR